MMTALEGNRMARNSRGAAALAAPAIGSFVAGTIATLALHLRRARHRHRLRLRPGGITSR